MEIYLNGWKTHPPLFELALNEIHFQRNTTEHRECTFFCTAKQSGEQRRGEEMSFYCFLFYLPCVCLDVYVCVSNAKAQDFCKGGGLLAQNYNSIL